MRRAIYPGSFDPITNGHLDIIERSSRLVDELVIGVLVNKAKNPLFSEEERVKMIKDVTCHLPNVKVMTFHGLLVDFAEELDANIIIRGLRAVTDFESELQMAQTNHKLRPEVETLFLTTNIEYSYLSSTIVREVSEFGGEVSQFVPDVVMQMLREKRKHKEQ